MLPWVQLRGGAGAARRVVARRGGLRLQPLGLQLPVAADQRLRPASGGRAVSTEARSQAEELLQRARENAVDLGFDPFEVYEPYLPIDLWQQALMMLHNGVGSSGLAVAAAALLIRAVTWPWNRAALKKQCDRMELMPAYMEIARALQKAQRSRGGADGSGAAGAAKAEGDIQRYSALLADFTKANNNFSPVQGMGYQFLCMMPLHFWGYFTLRGIVAHPDSFRSFVGEPSMWLDSLVLVDPYGALPAVTAMMVLINVELNTPAPRPGQEADAEYMRLVVRGACLTFAPVTTLLPSAILVFMATNTLYTSVLMWCYRRYFWVRPEIKPHWVIPKVKP